MNTIATEVTTHGEVTTTEPQALQRCRTWIRKMQLKGRSVPTLFKIVWAILTFPFLIGLMVWVHLTARKHWPLKCLGKANFGSTFLCRLPDSIQTCIYIYGVWEPDLTKFMESRLREGSIFIDLGANVGYYTLLASKMVGKGGRVIAVEASPTIFAMLEKNLEINPNTSNVRAVNVAVSDRVETIPFYIAPFGSLAWSSTTQRPNFRQEAEVPGAPLEEIIREDEIAGATLIKVDIEGAEERVVPGLKPFLEKCSPEAEFVVELTPRLWQVPERSIEEVLAPFFEMGYFAYQINNNYAPWRYLWANDTKRPKRVRGKIRLRPLLKEVELVLSRRDLPNL